MSRKASINNYDSLNKVRSRRLINKSILKKTPKLSILINEINFNIVKRLKNHRKSSQFKTFKIKISSSLYNIFKTDYNLSSRYKSNNQFVEAHNIIQKRYLNEEDVSQVDKNNFEINISNGKKIKYLDANFQEKLITELPTIGFRFFVERSKTH
ncbi:unnamed protein product [Brachionus calyciflorus]|uniref:Uncharacterized protein n=1 Tax=Brachionus calyciflorus TaxID=104777 RepID=A0A814PYX6_9BILA|nr:unnamed protein product [Brachionus calyciflorus]